MPQPISPNIFLLAGEDEFSKNLALESLKSKVIGPKPDGFNLDLFYGKDASARDIIASLETQSFSGAKKLVILKGAGLLSEDERPAFFKFIRDFRPKSVYFAVLMDGAQPEKDPFYKAFSQYAKVHYYKKLEPRQMAAQVIDIFKQRKKIITEKQAAMICEASGYDLTVCASFAEQLILFAGDRQGLVDSDITKFTSDALAETTVFSLLDRIGEKNPAAALTALKSIMRSEANASNLIGLLNWHISRLIALKRLLNKKASRAVISAELKAGDYMLNKLISQAGNFTLTRLKRDLEALVETDLLIKRSPVKGDFFIEMLVVKLAR